jgi:hypothetical protein
LNDLGLEELRHLLVEYARRVDRKGKQLMCLVTGNEDACSGRDDEFDNMVAPSPSSDPIDYGDGDNFDSYADEYGDMYGGDEHYGGDMHWNDEYHDEYKDEYQSHDQYKDEYKDEYQSDHHNEMVLDETEDAERSDVVVDVLEDEMPQHDSDDQVVVSEEVVVDGSVANGGEEESLVDDYLAEDDDTPYELPALVDLRKLLKSEKKELKNLEKEKRELEDAKNVSPELIPLKGKCFQVKQQSYTYEMCPFGDASQSSEDGGKTSLGHMVTEEDEEDEVLVSVKKFPELV